MYCKLGHLIKDIRLHAHISRAQFARLIDCSQQYIALIENGERRTTGDVLSRILTSPVFSKHSEDLIPLFKADVEQWLGERKRAELDKLSILPSF